MEAGHAGHRHACPADFAALPLEHHHAAAEVPEHRSQGGEPLGAQHQIVARERHDEEIGAEQIAADGEWRLSKDAWAGDALAVGHRGREAGAALDRQPGA